MMSERRFRELESQHRIACNLCGSNGASVRCDKCQFMAFCLSCDDMYHRHPKRRYHLRKAVALEVPAKYLDGCPQINKTNLQNDSHSSGLHPSKMPVPPPRRKKKGITLSSIKETFTSTGNKLRRFVSNEKLSIPSVNGNRYLNECRPKETPLIDKPMQTIRTQTLQNQRGVLPQNNSFGTLPTVRRHHSISVKLPETQPTPPPPPPPRPKEAKPIEAVYQNYRKTSLPARNTTINGNIGKVSSSIGDLSQEVPTSAVPERKIITNTFDRRNCSFNDLRTNPSIDDISNVNPQQFCQHFPPNQYCYGLPIHPWTTSSLNNSIEDINLNDVEDYDSDISARHNLNRNKRASIKRCNSAFQMYQSMSPCPPMQPFVYPYYYGYPCSGHTTPLPTCASPHPIRSFNMSSRGSVENMSTTSSSRGKPSAKVKLNQKPKPDPLESREQFSDSGGRSVTSSSRQQSDFDDDEDFFSVSENDSSDDDSLSREQKNSGQWSCRFCTFFNDNKNTICEICSKTNKKLKKTSNKSKVKVIRKKTNDNKSKQFPSNNNNNNNNTNNNRNKVIELDFDEKLINEQKEIEKELIRRLENERRIEEENEKICRKEDYIKKKNLGLQVEDRLIEQIRKDQEFNHLNNDKNELKLESNEVNVEKKSEQKFVENKSTECQTNEEKVNEIKTTDTSIQAKGEHISKKLDEKCAKSIQCQIDDKSTVKLNDKPIENSDNRTVEQNIQNSSLNSESNSVTNRQTNQFIGNNGYNNFVHQNQQNMSTPMTSMGQQFNDYNDRRTAYGSETMFNQNSNQFQNPYNNYPMNPMTPLMSPMSPNIMSMNPLMSGYPMVPPMFSSNPLQNMYSPPYQQSLNGSQTGLDRFGYRSNSITSEQSFINPLQSQIGSRYSSCENLHSITQLNEKNQQKSPIDSGLHLVQVLRDAEKNGFTSVDVEVALNFSPDKPIEWLEENWNNMCETVLTLTNNQIMQNQTKSGNKRLNQLNLLTEEEAKEGLRSTKGNIWQAIEKCVKTKQNKMIKDINGPNIASDDKNKGSFSLKISGFGSGRDNEDINENIETTEVEEQQVLVERQSSDDKVLLTALTVHTSEVQRIETNADRKTMERLLTDWKIEKLSSERFRQQEKERQKIRKFMELQKKMSEFESDDSEQEVEFHDVPNNNNPRIDESPLTAVDYNELPDQVSGDISEEKWQINSEFEFINKSLENNVNEVTERDVNEVSDFEEYNSNSESDLSDEFDAIDARIQAKLRDNFNLAKSEDLPSNEPISSEVIEKLVEKFGENSLSGNQRIDNLKKTLIESNVESNVESNAVNNENLEPIDVKSDTKKEISESEAKEMMTEIDRNVRRSLEELEQMELNVLQSQINNQEFAGNQMYDESFGWARTEYECELCCEIYSINDLVAMISCTHYACKECLQKYYCVQIREAQRLIIRCPFCDQPDMDPDDDDKVFEYLGLLDQMLKHLVPLDVYELFQRKLRDRALMRDPGFLWCTQCSSGFIAPNPQAKTIMCPDCKNLTCTLCKKKWRKQHMDITCEQFAEWEKANDPSFAEQQLDKHLKEFGIECPNCKFRYQLAKGGCMHFRCSQCSYDFCGGCARPFKMGNRCGISPYCEKLGLHSHHPRNCLFYLRDKDTDKLQSLLDKHKIKYKTKLESDHKSNRCPVMEQKHSSYGLKDEACNRFTENAGLCRLHYKEYLGDLIWKNGIDPIYIFNGEELELVLKRENIKLPPKDLSDRRQERKEEYHKQMIDLILERVPLNLNH